MRYLILCLVCICSSFSRGLGAQTATLSVADQYITNGAYTFSIVTSASGGDIGPNPGSTAAVNTGVTGIPAGSSASFGVFSIHWK